MTVKRSLPKAGLHVLALAAAGAVCALAVSCGGSSGEGVARVETNETTTTTGAGSQNSGSDPNPAAYSACMRKNGVPTFPEPDSEGRLVLKGDSGIDPRSARFEAATSACRELAPAGPSPEQQAATLAGLLELAACMRRNGVPNFPDPKRQADGGVGIELEPGSDSSTQFKEAEKACEELLPGAGKPPVGPVPQP